MLQALHAQRCRARARGAAASAGLPADPRPAPDPHLTAATPLAGCPAVEARLWQDAAEVRGQGAHGRVPWGVRRQGALGGATFGAAESGTVSMLAPNDADASAHPSTVQLRPKMGFKRGFRRFK